jgi:hypothetical protein
MSRHGCDDVLAWRKQWCVEHGFVSAWHEIVVTNRRPEDGSIRSSPITGRVASSGSPGMFQTNLFDYPKYVIANTPRISGTPSAGSAITPYERDELAPLRLAILGHYREQGRTFPTAAPTSSPRCPNGRQGSSHPFPAVGRAYVPPSRGAGTTAVVRCADAGLIDRHFRGGRRLR